MKTGLLVVAVLLVGFVIGYWVSSSDQGGAPMESRAKLWLQRASGAAQEAAGVSREAACERLGNIYDQLCIAHCPRCGSSCPGWYVEGCPDICWKNTNEMKQDCRQGDLSWIRFPEPTDSEPSPAAPKRPAP